MRPCVREDIPDVALQKAESILPSLDKVTSTGAPPGPKASVRVFVRSTLMAILGNDIAINAYREGKLPLPDGAIIARISWAYVPSDENNKVFGRTQSFVAGPPPDWYPQFMVKDSKKYAATVGWGYAQFDKDGKRVPEAKLKTCYPCHEPIKARDYLFTRYTP